MNMLGGLRVHPCPEDGGGFGAGSCSPAVKFFTIPIEPCKRGLKCPKNSCAPKDSLDLALSSCYDQHRQWNVSKQLVKMQCPTYTLFSWGMMRNNKRIEREMLGIGPSAQETNDCLPSVSYYHAPIKESLKKKTNLPCLPYYNY